MSLVKKQVSYGKGLIFRFSGGVNDAKLTLSVRMGGEGSSQNLCLVFECTKKCSFGLCFTES